MNNVQESDAFEDMESNNKELLVKGENDDEEENEEVTHERNIHPHQSTTVKFSRITNDLDTEDRTDEIIERQPIAEPEPIMLPDSTMNGNILTAPEVSTPGEPQKEEAKSGETGLSEKANSDEITDSNADQKAGQIADSTTDTH